jgi:hypothetical protein
VDAADPWWAEAGLSGATITTRRDSLARAILLESGSDSASTRRRSPRGATPITWRKSTDQRVQTL